MKETSSTSLNSMDTRYNLIWKLVSKNFQFQFGHQNLFAIWQSSIKISNIIVFAINNNKIIYHIMDDDRCWMFKLFSIINFTIYSLCWSYTTLHGWSMMQINMIEVHTIWMILWWKNYFFKMQMSPLCIALHLWYHFHSNKD